jgi:hypothetical protein
MIYLLVFSCSLFIFYLAEKTQSIKIIHSPLVAIALLLPSILAGCRDLTIGIDILVYMEPCFRIAKSCYTYSSFHEQTMEIELLYGFLVYIVASCVDNIAWLLFLQQFIIIFLVYFSAYQLREYVPIWVFMFVYFFGFFYIGLCQVRQILALSFCLASFAFLLNQKFLKSFIWFLPSLGLHGSASIYLIVYLVFYLINEHTTRIVLLFMTIGMAILALLVVNMENITTFFLLDQVISSDFKYINYVYLIKGQNFIYTTRLVYYIFMFILSQYIEYIYNIKLCVLSKCLLLICIILTILGYFTIGFVIERCIYYFSFLSIIFLPIVLYKKRMCLHCGLFLLFLCFLLSYWYKTVVVEGAMGTYPYSSTILGIN